MIRVYNQTIPANGFAKIVTDATYIRCLNSSGVKFRAILDKPDGKGSTTFVFEAGLGFQTERFTAIRLEALDGSSVDVDIVVSNEGEVTDSRLVMTGVMSVTTMASEAVDIPAIQTIVNADDSLEVIPARTNRKQATLQLSGECWVGNKANGILVTGDIVWESRAALTLVAKSAGTTVRVLEELN